MIQQNKIWLLIILTVLVFVLWKAPTSSFSTKPESVQPITQVDITTPSLKESVESKEEDSLEFLLKGLIKNNMETTDLSAAVTLNNCTLIYKDKLYTTISCSAHIDTLYASKEPVVLPFIVYQETFESGSHFLENPNNSQWLVSVNKKEDEHRIYYTAPDEAYSFFYSKELAHVFEKMSASIEDGK